MMSLLPHHHHTTRTDGVARKNSFRPRGSIDLTSSILGTTNNVASSPLQGSSTISAVSSSTGPTILSSPSTATRSRSLSQSQQPQQQEALAVFEEESDDEA